MKQHCSDLESQEQYDTTANGLEEHCNSNNDLVNQFAAELEAAKSRLSSTSNQAITPPPPRHPTDTTSTCATINGDIESSVKTMAAVSGGSIGPAQKPSFGHRAGFDAFMTGYVFAYFAAVTNPNKRSVSSLNEAMIAGLSPMRNRLSNRNKPVPLILAKSQFEKTSQTHRDNCLKIAEFKNLS